MERPLLALITVALMGCGGNGGDTGATDTAPQPIGTDLSAYDLPLSVTLPDAQVTGGAEPELRWREEEGVFSIKAGDRFSLRIAEDVGDISRLKADLERDPVRVAKIITEEPGLLVYRLEFPADPSLVFIQFMQVIQVDGRSFVVESDPEMRFNEADVERMRTAVAANQQPA